MSGVTLHPVESSMLSHVGHDPASKTLTIQFTEGKRHDHDGVPPAVYATSLASSSKGGFCNGEIGSGPLYPQVRGRR